MAEKKLEQWELMVMVRPFSTVEVVEFILV